MGNPPPHPHRRRIILALGTCTALSLAGDLTLYAVLPAYAPSRGISLAAVGLLLSVNRLIRLPLNPIVGLLYNNRPRRPFLVLSFALGFISTLLYLFVSGTGAFVAARMLWGAGWSLMIIGSYIVILDISNPEERGVSSGALQSFYFAALVIHPLLGGVLSDQFGFEVALWACTGMAAAGFLLALFGIPETFAGSPSVDPGEGKVPAGSPTRSLTGWLRPILTLPNFTVNYINLLTYFATEGMFMSTITLFLKNELGGGFSIGGMVLPAATAGGAALAFRSALSSGAAPLAGRISDRAGTRWGVLTLGVLSGVAGIGLLGLVPSRGLFIVGIILAAVCAGFTLSVLPPLMRELNPEQSAGTLMGLLSTTGDIGMAVAPLAAYSLTGALSLPVVYLIGAGALATSLPFLFLSARRRRITMVQAS